MSGPTVLSIDWENLPPRERTVLCFLVVGGDLLLIRKKTGLGRGMFNVPGGRIEPGEDPLDAAVRETREETGLTPRGLVPAGNLLFYFAEGFLHTCRVFSAGAFEGTAVRTREADPLWVPVEAIPYRRMWEGDRHWIPLVLAGKPFSGKLVFDGERLLDAEVIPDPETR